MTRLGCPLCGKKVDATPTGWARHIVLKCQGVGLETFDERTSAIVCPCRQIVGYVQGGWDSDDFEHQFVSLLADHFFSVQYKDQKPGRKFNLAEHLIKKFILEE